MAYKVLYGKNIKVGGILGRGKGTEECELDLVGVRWEMYVVGCNFRSSLFYKKC